MKKNDRRARIGRGGFAYTVGMSMTPKTLMREAEKLREKLIGWRRNLHACAEVGFELTQTTAFVRERLEEMGCAPETCGKSSLITDVGSGKTALIRADMDGLPIREKTGLSFACKKGNMHACGHDMHTAMLLGAAHILKRMEKDLPCKVRLLFQAAEETLSGAKAAIDDGVLQGVERAAMLHVLTDTELPTGSVVVASAGVSAPSADYFEITLRGKACHGSAPQNGIDALQAAAHIVIALQELPAREISISDPAVITVGTFSAGNAANAIADTATVKGTMRTFNEKGRYALKRRIEQIAKGIGRAFRCRTGVRFLSGCPSLYNDKETSAAAEKAVRTLLGEKKTFTSKQLSGGGVEAKNGGSEDFAYISRAVPSVMLALAAGEPAKGYAYPLHHPKANFDESVLPIGAATYAALAIWG